MTSVKTYGWLGKERLEFINDNPKVLSLLYDLGLLPEEISARVRGYVEEAVKAERQRCITAVENLEKLTQEGNNDFQYSRVMAMLARVRYAISKDDSQEGKATV